MVKVLDVTQFTFDGFPEEEFKTLGEAFEYVSEQIEDGFGDRYEICVDDNPHHNISVDARGFVDV